jgi:hypothetical protein
MHGFMGCSTLRERWRNLKECEVRHTGVGHSRTASFWRLGSSRGLQTEPLVRRGIEPSIGWLSWAVQVAGFGCGEKRTSRIPTRIAGSCQVLEMARYPRPKSKFLEANANRHDRRRSAITHLIKAMGSWHQYFSSAGLLCPRSSRRVSTREEGTGCRAQGAGHQATSSSVFCKNHQ